MFNTPEEMQKYVCEGCNDLYNPETETYVFLYTEEGAICTYSVTPEEAVLLEYEILHCGSEYWGERLGVGGNIIESDNVKEYFEKEFQKPGWMDTKDVTTLIGKSEYSISMNKINKELEEKKEKEKETPKRTEKHMNRGGIEL